MVTQACFGGSVGLCCLFAKKYVLGFPLLLETFFLPISLSAAAPPSASPPAAVAHHHLQCHPVMCTPSVWNSGIS